MIILGIFLIILGVWLYLAGKYSKGAEVWKMIAVFCVVMGIVFTISPLLTSFENTTTTTNSVYSSYPKSGTTELQKKREDWRKRANEAYEKNNYGFY